MIVLLDTCVLIDDSYPFVPGVVYRASALSKAELEAGLLSAATPEDHAQRVRRLADLDADFDWIDFDAPAAKSFGFLSAELRARGKRALSRRIDILLAAHAHAIGAAFMTANRGDFQHVEDLIAVVYPDRLTAADVAPRWTPPLPAGPLALEGSAVGCGRIVTTTGLPCFLAAGHADGHCSR